MYVSKISDWLGSFNNEIQSERNLFVQYLPEVIENENKQMGMSSKLFLQQNMLHFGTWHGEMGIEEFCNIFL